jgi:hypothetical protein
VYVLTLSDPDALERLCEFLRRVHVDGRPALDGTVQASIPGAVSPLHERRELAGYVTTWNALNPHSTLELLEQHDQ